MDNSENNNIQSDYWKRRCLLAEECLNATPCDPDITQKQIEAWAAYHAFIKEYGQFPASENIAL